MSRRSAKVLSGCVSVVSDAAGNLTRDHRGYEYEYDTENRMTKVKKPLGAGFVVVVTFDYDALGRRIEKVDASAGTTTRYYYDDQRVAVQTQVSGGVETDDRYFDFGNYLDEVLVMGGTSAWAWPTLRATFEYDYLLQSQRKFLHETGFLENLLVQRAVSNTV